MESKNAASNNAPVPCRLSVLLACEAPVAAILRRGPTQRVQLILWHTDSDTFEEGQWFYGRIYEQYSDLSPDGKLFLYLARKPETPERCSSPTTYKWTALSHPPYFTALALWPAGDTWDGGGVFLSANSIWLCYNERHLKKRTFNHFSLKASLNAQGFRERDLRNGWEIVQEGIFDRKRLSESGTGRFLGIRAVTHQPTIWRKYRPDRRYCLVWEIYREPDFSFVSLVYLVNEATGQQEIVEETTWIDWDQQGRLVLARAGKLFASQDAFGYPLSVHELADFNKNTPRPVIAPYQGIHW